ncbi:hypothetical protein Droror1_Dr00020728 [Drosera rotundifolia]
MNRKTARVAYCESVCAAGCSAAGMVRGVEARRRHGGRFASSPAAVAAAVSCCSEENSVAMQCSFFLYNGVGFVLTTGVNSAYVLGYSSAILVPLGWVAGIIELIAATLISLYANGLFAKLHEYGGTRHQI